jgi:hypothetical protein
VLGLQVATVVLSGGHIYILGEAYAFGVVWSFTLQAVALVVLRYTSPGAREWRVPINLRIGSFELPIGLLSITLALFSIAVVNLFTKQVATVSGIAFTLALYVVFVVSERTILLRRSGADRGLDNFQLLPSANVTQEDLDVRPGNVLVPVRDPNTLVHLKWVLDGTDTSTRDIVVMTVRLLRGPHTGYRDFDTARLFHDYEQMLFTKVVAVAEREGRPVRLLVAPSTNVAQAIAHTAVRLLSTEIVLGESAIFNGAELASMVGEAWDRIEKDRNVRSLLVVCKRDRTLETFHLGPHVPPLTEEDLELIHTLWLDAVAKYGLDIHHRDVVRTALEDLAGDMSAAARKRAMDLIGAHLAEPARQVELGKEHARPAWAALRLSASAAAGRACRRWLRGNPR